MDINLLKVKNRWEELVDTAIERMLEKEPRLHVGSAVLMWVRLRLTATARLCAGRCRCRRRLPPVR